jgi:hypothetical protein
VKDHRPMPIRTSSPPTYHTAEATSTHNNGPATTVCPPPFMSLNAPRTVFLNEYVQ